MGCLGSQMKVKWRTCIKMEEIKDKDLEGCTYRPELREKRVGISKTQTLIALKVMQD